MVRGRRSVGADLDPMLEVVAQDYEAVKTTLTILTIYVPVVLALLVAACAGGGRTATR